MSSDGKKKLKNQNFNSENTETGYYPNLSVIIERSESKDEIEWTFEEALKVIGEF